MRRYELNNLGDILGRLGDVKNGLEKVSRRFCSPCLLVQKLSHTAWWTKKLVKVSLVLYNM